MCFVGVFLCEVIFFFVGWFEVVKYDIEYFWEVGGFCSGGEVEFERV